MAMSTKHDAGSAATEAAKLPFSRLGAFSLFVLVAIAAVGTSAAKADLILSTPSGLSVGDRFRFIFVTKGATPATSTSLAYYDSFVSSDVATNFGIVTYNGNPITGWQALGSTDTTSAFDHLGGSQANVSVYRPDGTIIASSLTTNANGLWSGSILNRNNQLLDGTTVAPATGLYPYPWTGTLKTGQKAVFGLNSYTLGNTDPYYGEAPLTNDQWIESSTDDGTLDSSLIGLSPELTVPGAPSAVPEIDPNSLGSVLALVLGSLGLLERRRLKAA